MKPVFIFSLPRAGSTLLQRILTAHSKISSTSEPWLLLPFIYARKEKGSFTEYSHFCSHRALNDFVEALPEKDDDYHAMLNEFLTGLYEKQCRQGDVYFIDKTPRYYLIIPEIAKIFPEAKFIFLFRNPSHVFSSIISTFGNGRLNRLHSYDIDIKEGSAYLADGCDLIRDRSYVLKYEDLINEPEKHVKEIFDYLCVENETQVVSQFSQTKFDGSMGDPTGVKKYSSISTDSLNTWRNTIRSHYMKKVILWRLNDIDEKIYRVHGYNKNEILHDVSALPVSSLGLKDAFDYLTSRLIPLLNLNLFFSRNGKWSKKKYLS